MERRWGLLSSICSIQRRARDGAIASPDRSSGRSTRLAPGRAIGARYGPKSSEWELPMATVNIDIDQGTVTLRGAFPPEEEHPSRAWAHRGLSRVRGHAAARRGFDGSDQG